MAELGGEKHLAGGGVSLSHPGSHTAGGTLDALPYQSVNSLLQLNRLLCVCVAFEARLDVPLRPLLRSEVGHCGGRLGAGGGGA